MNTRSFTRACWQVPVFTSLLFASAACSAEPSTFDLQDPRSPLHLVRSIPLPNVHGRIDHLALDPNSNHLFVAELGNGSLDDVDLTSGSVARRVAGLHEPQGVAFLPAQKEVALACGDGTVRFYRSSDLRIVASMKLGDDADNVRVDRRNGNLVVGYGAGALAVIDPATHRLVRTVTMPAHPEGFEIIASHALVNVPDAHKIVFADIDMGHVTKAVTTGTHFGNFPLGSNAAGSRIAVAFRLPNSLSLLDPRSGETVFSSPICGDADDLFFRASQIVVLCGEGVADLVEATGHHGIVRVTTQRGSRTGLLDSAHDRLFIAAPAAKSAAAILELAFK